MQNLCAWKFGLPDEISNWGSLVADEREGLFTGQSRIEARKTGLIN